MRFYEISLTQPGSTEPIRQWSSRPKGVYDPNALNIEFDIPVATYGNPIGTQPLSIEGIALDDLSHAKQFTGLELTLKAGMQAGLPLANPAQAGIITKGTVWQSFGNWQGTDMTLDFVIAPSIYSQDIPGNFVLDWKANTPLSQALANTFDIVFPGVPQSINISPTWVLNHHEVGYYHSLETYATNISKLTGGNVEIVKQAGRIIVYDTTYTPPPIKIQFTDLIGQPTWIAVNTIQIKTVLRADIMLGSIIQLPESMQNVPGMALTTRESHPSQMKYKTTFNGQFKVSAIRHVGNFRSANGDAWITIINCVPANG